MKVPNYIAKKLAEEAKKQKRKTWAEVGRDTLDLATGAFKE
jgi:hypothetical protein